MKNTAFKLRPIEPRDIRDAIRLSNAEGWNQAEKDWRLLIESPGNICMLAEYGEKIIGTTTVINYSNQVAWVGMVLVDKEFRGHGVSKALLAEILKKIESKSVKLDATPEGQRVYTKFGFRDEYLIARMTNLAPHSQPLTTGDSEILHGPVQAKDKAEIIAYDEHVFGANRSVLMEFLTTQYPRKVWLLKRNNKVAGFVLGREGNKYHHIGPLFASGTTDAKALMAKALAELINQPVVIDVPCFKEDFITWLSAFGFIRQRCFTRMYQNENLFPGIPGNQYLICGPEFG